MSVARNYKTNAIVLRARNLGEADKIFTLFTDTRGKLDAVGKGVRRSNSRLAGRLEFGTESALLMHRGRNLDVISSAQIERSSWVALNSPGAFAAGHLIAELVDGFCELDLAMPDVYALVRGALATLGTAEDPAAIVPRFEARLLVALGIGPESDGCVRCGTAFEAEPAWADLEAGGLSCERCRPHRADALPLAAGDVDSFRGLHAARGGSVRATLLATPAAARAVDAFVVWHLGRRPKAGRMLDDLAQAR